MTDDHPDWNVARDDYGLQMVTHRHGDIDATAYLYSSPDEVWSECTMCGARITLPTGSTTIPVSGQ